VIRVDPAHPANALALRTLRARAPSARPVVAAAEAKDPYYRCGCHPDTVERVWDSIGTQLPSDGRCVVFGRPAVVQPESGVILAMCLGTSYILRVVETDLPAALAAGCRQSQEWGAGSSGHVTHLVEEYGPDWVFARWLDDEFAWCRAAYDRYCMAQTAADAMLTNSTPAEVTPNRDS
jgi:hypothetical protein